MIEPRAYHTLTADERHALESVRRALATYQTTIDQLREADRTDDWAAVRRLAPQTPIIIGVADSVWSIIFPDTDRATLSHGQRLGLVLAYLEAVDAARQQLAAQPDSTTLAA